MPGGPKISTTAARRQPTVTAGQSKNPGPPKDPPQPTPDPAPEHVMPPVPQSFEAAHAYLVGQNLLRKKDKVIPGTVVNLLNQIAQHPDLHPTFAVALTAIALVTPQALDLSSLIISSMNRVTERLDDLEADTKKLLENTPNSETKEDQMVHLLSTVDKAAASADAAEKAAEESQRMLIAFADAQEGQPFQPVTAKNRQSHKGPALPPQKEAFRDSQPARRQQNSTGNDRHSVLFPSLTSKTISDLRAKGATILVQPDAGVLAKSLDGLDSKALTQKATLAYEAAWKELEATSFPANNNLQGMPRIRFRSADRIASGGIIYGLENREQALFLCQARVARAFENGFGAARLMGQRVELFLQSAPLSWNPESEECIRSLERENNLECGDILHCMWVKPAHRRNPLQSRAVVKVSLRSEDVADSLIARQSCALECGRVKFRRVEEEPFRCLKCQAFGHRAAICKAPRDICSQCGGDHRSPACEDRSKTFCANCKSEDHASWDRRCKIFIEERNRLNDRKPENRRMFFDPTREVQVEGQGETATTPPRPSRAPRAPPPPATPKRPLPTLGDFVTGKPGTIPALLTRQTKGKSPVRGTVRKERDPSEEWDDALLVTAPRRSVTPTTIRPLAYVPASPPSPTGFDRSKLMLRPVTVSRSRSSSVSSVLSEATAHPPSPSPRASSASRSTRVSSL